jgi:two-component system NtrC family sensor kinase
LSKVVQAALSSLDSAESLVNEYCTQSEDSKSPWKLADFGTVVEDFLHLQAVVCRAAGISVSFERDLELPRVRLDALKIKQVIANLCKNANEAMPRGGNLVLKVFRAQQMVVLEVSDSGIGMPRGLNVFELFKTTKASGHGVGLALAQEIISAHRGTISYTSEPNRGTTFRVSLPIEE